MSLYFNLVNNLICFANLYRNYLEQNNLNYSFDNDVPRFAWLKDIYSEKNIEDKIVDVSYDKKQLLYKKDISNPLSSNELVDIPAIFFQDDITIKDLVFFLKLSLSFSVKLSLKDVVLNDDIV